MKKIVVNKNAPKQSPAVGNIDAFIQQFHVFTIDEKIGTFTALKHDLAGAIEAEAKATEERIIFLKSAFSNLLNK